MQRKPQIPTNDLDSFIKGAKDEKTRLPDQEQTKQLSIPQDEADPDKMRRQTYYVTELYIQAIEQMAFYEKMDKSEIVREALKQYIPTKYINLSVRK